MRRKEADINPLLDTCHRLAVLPSCRLTVLPSHRLTSLHLLSYCTRSMELLVSVQYYYGTVLLYEYCYSINALPVLYGYHSRACPPYKSPSHIISFRSPAMHFRLASLKLWLLWLTLRQDSDFQLQKTNSTVLIIQSHPVSFPSQRINHTRKQ